MVFRMARPTSRLGARNWQYRSTHPFRSASLMRCRRPARVATGDWSRPVIVSDHAGKLELPWKQGSESSVVFLGWLEI
jgi:hypothetical protein